jgi:uncharacterized protein YkwD
MGKKYKKPRPRRLSALVTAKSFVSRPRLVVPVILAIIIGYTAVRTFGVGQADYNHAAGVTVVEIRSEAPIQIANGDAVPLGLRLRLYGDGALVCGTGGQLTYAKLNPQQAQVLVKRLVNSGILATAHTVSAATDNTAVGKYQSVYLNLLSGTQTFTYYDGDRPAPYNQVDAAVTSSCNSVTGPVPAGITAEPAAAMSTTPEPEVSVVGRVMRWLAPDAAAWTMYGIENEEISEINHINIERQTVGRTYFTRIACLSAMARAQARAIATKQTLFHANGGTVLPTYCDNSWTNWGENVGVVSGCNYQGFDSCENTLFSAFINSPEHRSNINSASYRFVGVGAYRDSLGKLWVAQEFGNCSGCTAKWTAAMPSARPSLATSLAPGATIPRGGIMKVTAGYKNVGAVGVTGTILNSSGAAAATISAVSGAGSDPYFLGSGSTAFGTAMQPGTYDHAYWKFSLIPASGQGWSTLSTSYNLTVKPTAAVGSSFCLYADVHGSNEPIFRSGRYCYTVGQ